MDDIKTKYIGPKDGRGSRLKASCKRGSITIPYPYAVGATERHEMVANKLRLKLAAKDAAAKQRNDGAADKLAVAARLVINNWSTGDLAGAVRLLDMALEDFDKKGKAK